MWAVIKIFKIIEAILLDDQSLLDVPCSLSKSAFFYAPHWKYSVNYFFPIFRSISVFLGGFTEGNWCINAILGYHYKNDKEENIFLHD